MKSINKSKSSRKSSRKSAARKSAARKSAVRKSAARKSAARKSSRKSAVRKSSRKSAARSRKSTRKSAARKSSRKSAAHVRLSSDFVITHLNKTVLLFQFIKSQNGWKKDDKGTYFKICGFTNNEEYDLDLAPPLSRTLKKYIVLHQRGERYPIVIQNNGEILRGGYCFFV